MGHAASGPLKNKWVKLGLGAAAATTGAGALGIGPMAGLLGLTEGAAAAIPAAGAALPGASGLTELAGATGGALAGTPSVGTPLGGVLGNVGKGLYAANKASGLLGLGQPQSMPPATPPPQVAVAPTRLPSMATPSGIDPKLLEILQRLQQSQGGSYG